MPMKKSDYPTDWDWLSRQVRKRNGGRCELCFAPNGKLVYRYNKYEYPWYLALGAAQGVTKIVLTVHHIDNDKMNSDENNLISLCQRCHLRLDKVKHVKNRRETIARKKAGGA